MRSMLIETNAVDVDRDECGQFGRSVGGGERRRLAQFIQRAGIKITLGDRIDLSAWETIP
jgi:hypothetical protein